jgi:outer membrane protein assembly factor BamD
VRYSRSAVAAVLAVVVAAILSFGGCSSSEETTMLSAEERFALGMRLFNDEDYLEAINEFTVVTLQYQGSAEADDAQYYLGECRFRREEYLLAAFEYQQLLRNMPASPLVPDAQFRIGLCYYNLSPKSTLDQEYTRKAIDELQTFVEYNPQHAGKPEAERLIADLTGRLAKKSFEIAEQYATLEYYRAAAFYYDDVIEKYHDTEYAPPSYIGKVRMLIGRRKYDDALQTIASFLEKFPSSELRAEALRLKARAEDGRASTPLSGRPASVPPQ